MSIFEERTMKTIALLMFALLFAATASAQTLNIATVTPEGSEWMKEMRASAAEINAQTDGRVTVKYYGGGSRGTDAKVLREMRLGRLQGGVFTPSALMEQYKDIGLYGLPMVFNSIEEANHVRSVMDKKIIAGLEEAGYVTFGFAATGFAMMMSNEPVASLDDLRGTRIWVPEGDDLSKATMDALGVNAIPLALTDVYTALQTGALDIVTMSSVGAVLLQYHTKLKYVTDLPLIYTFGLMAIDKKAFTKLSASDQQVVTAVLSELYSRFDKQNVEDELAAKEALFKAGMQQVVPAAGPLAELQAKLRQSNDDIAAQGLVSADLYKELLALVAEYRSGVQ
jgi:TRAP-type C4-dicarboxylate transport system substrate-binding protein